MVGYVNHLYNVVIGYNFRAQMKKVMLTVFRNNHESQEFFKKKLKYVALDLPWIEVKFCSKIKLFTCSAICSCMGL